MDDNELEHWMSVTHDDGHRHDFAFSKRTRQLFVNGEALVTEKRWGTVERRIAVTGLVIASIVAITTVVQTIGIVTSLGQSDFAYCLAYVEADILDLSPHATDAKSRALGACLPAKS